MSFDAHARRIFRGCLACAAVGGAIAAAIASADVELSDQRPPAPLPQLLQPRDIPHNLPPAMASGDSIFAAPAIINRPADARSARRTWAVNRLLQPDEPRNPQKEPSQLPVPGEKIPAGEGNNPGIKAPTYGDTELRPIGALTVNIMPSGGQVPQETDPRRMLEREFGPTEYRRAQLDYCYYWESPGFFHRPLYFEQPNLERYGYTWGPAQPFISAAQFWVKIPLLPYMMAVHCPQEPVYSLGYYRPGSRVPYQINWPEVRLDAITVETAFITGLVFLIP